MGESLKALKKAEAEHKKAEETLRKKQHLNELLLDNLSHFEVIIHKDRPFLLANRIVREFGAKVGGYCWGDSGHSQFIPEKDKKYINDHKKVPPGNTRCCSCLADEALKN